jgi:hypothetical protein
MSRLSAAFAKGHAALVCFVTGVIPRPRPRPPFSTRWSKAAPM